jgi:hypothetical protein
MIRTVSTIAGTTVVHINDEATDVDAADCALCELTADEAVEVVLRRIRIGVVFTVCAGCAERTTDAINERLYRQPARGRA